MRLHKYNRYSEVLVAGYSEKNKEHYEIKGCQMS